MSDLLQHGEGALRSATALLRANGGGPATLRMPAPAIPNDASEQLGLATPLFEDLPLGPAVFHHAVSVRTLLVGAEAVRALCQTLAFDAAELLFESAAGVVVDGVLYSIESSVAARAFGAPYNYTLTLRAPVR